MSPRYNPYLSDKNVDCEQMLCTEFHNLYLYSTDTLSEETTGTKTGKVRPPRGKVGQTHHKNVKVRVDQQDGTSSAETLIPLAERSVSKRITDKMLRDKICSYTSPTGKKYIKSRFDKGREWIDFLGNTGSEDMIRIFNEAVNDLLYGVRAPESFPPFPYQQNIVDWAIQRYKQGATDLLINAIMRSGKCFIAYEIARVFGAKYVLVITAKPGVDDSWSELLPEGEKAHKNYANWKYLSYIKYKRTTLPFDDTCNVVFVSLQYINKHFNNKNNKLLNQIFSTKWDNIFFDEQHYATETDNTQQVFARLSFKLKIELSGTPYKTLLSGRFPQENICNFDYVDEQKIRAEARKDPTSDLWKRFQYRAKLNWAMIHIPNKIKNLLSLEDGFTLAKLFSTDKSGQFLNLQTVVEFLRFVQQVYKNPPYIFKNISRLNDHTLWILPNDIKAIAAFKRLLETHPYFKKFLIINASGINGVKTIQKVRDTIANVEANKTNYEGTITLTCGRFLEGTTVPEWMAVHQMNDDKSAQEYFQGCFRDKSPWEQGKKENALVYDYNPQRAIEVIYKVALDTADHKNSQSTKQRLDEWLKCSDLYDYSDNVWTTFDGTEIINQANKDIALHIDSFGDITPTAGLITIEVIALMEGKEAEKQRMVKTELNDNDIFAGKNKQHEPKASSQQIHANEIKLTIQKIKTAIKRIPELIYNTKFCENKINSVDDLFQYPNKSMVLIHTGLSTDTWKCVLSTLSSEHQDKLNRRIDAINNSGQL